MMLEADVSLGHLYGTSLDEPPIPIMAHPPALLSDLSLESYVEQILAAIEEVCLS